MKTINKILAAVLAVTIFAYVVFSIVAGAETVKAFELKHARQLYNDAEQAPDPTPGNLHLLNEKAYLMACLETATNDSISLWIDLTDSLALLTLKGVVLHQAKISNFSKSAFFSGIDPLLLSYSLNKPGIVSHITSTIKKETFTSMKAPSNSNDIIQAPSVPDTGINHQPVFYSLQLENGFQLNVMQNEISSWQDLSSMLLFDWNKKWQLFKKISEGIFKFKTPRYSPEITIKLCRKDARSIYRALPENAMIVLGL